MISRLTQKTELTNTVPPLLVTLHLREREDCVLIPQIEPPTENISQKMSGYHVSSASQEDYELIDWEITNLDRKIRMGDPDYINIGSSESEHGLHYSIEELNKTLKPFFKN